MTEKIYLSGYTKKNNSGIHCVELENINGYINSDILWTLEEENPSYIALSEDKNILISVSSKGNGGIVLYSFNGESYSEVDYFLDMGKAPCHIYYDDKRSLAFVSNYHKGNVFVFEVVKKSGKPIGLDLKDRIDIVGHSIKSPEQDSSKCHMVTLDNDGKNMFIVNLGTDKVYVYSISDEKIINSVSVYEAKQGMGPRHMEFSKDGKIAYLLGELDSNIEVLSYDKINGDLTLIERIKVLPGGYQGENSAAAIKRTSDGKFLYTSNRGHDSISIFRIDENGSLEFVDRYCTIGKTPRDFCFSKDENYVIIGFQDSEFISIVERNTENGKLLINEEKKLELSEIVCVIS